jgi:hypothetical protein
MVVACERYTNVLLGILVTPNPDPLHATRPRQTGSDKPWKEQNAVRPSGAIMVERDRRRTIVLHLSPFEIHQLII